MNIFEWEADGIERAAYALAHWLKSTQPERVEWTPDGDGGQGRTALDVVQECTGANRRFIAMLTGQPPADATATATATDASQQLVASAAELANVVRGLDESVLQKVFETPFGKIPAPVLLQLPANHMMYHGGQINYIQRLYGDTEFHRPTAPGQG